jgi:hypothetical protein
MSNKKVVIFKVLKAKDGWHLWKFQHELMGTYYKKSFAEAEKRTHEKLYLVPTMDICKKMLNHPDFKQIKKMLQKKEQKCTQDNQR